jgi:hypothetical protein
MYFPNIPLQKLNAVETVLQVHMTGCQQKRIHMRKYLDKENALFEEWQDRIRENEPVADFAPDGILYRGPIEFNDNGTGYKPRTVGNSAIQWDTAPKRLLILTKDLYDTDGGWDIRYDTGRVWDAGMFVVRTSRARFYSNLTLWSYALLDASAGNPIDEFDMTPSWDELREFYETAPIARVNCKKTVGADTCPYDVLRKHLETYGDLLQRQIGMYDADIILCCGGSDLIKDFVKKTYLPDLENVEETDWMYYSKSRNKLVVNNYHPSYPGCTYENMYEAMMREMRIFLERFPEFTKPGR